MMEINSELPVAELVDSIGGGTPSKSDTRFWNGEIPWVSPKDMKVWDIYGSQDHVTNDAITNSTCKLVAPPAILLVVRGMILAHTIPVGISRVPLVINQDMKALIPKSGVDPEYLAFMIKGASRALLERVNIAGHGTLRLTTESWESLRIRLPSGQEQRRIVARIKECLDRVEEIENLRDETRSEAEALLPSMLNDHFVELAGEYESVEIAEVAEETRYGTSRKCASTPDGVAILRIPNVAGGFINFGNLKYCKLENDELRRLQLREGDLLFVRTNGSRDLVGRCAIFDEHGQDTRYAFASYLIRVRLDRSKMLPHYLAFFLNSTHGRTEIDQRRRTSAGQFNINSENLRNISMPLPPLDVQDQVVRAISIQQESAGALQNELAEAQKEASHLREAILRKAFAGEL